jgi:hypothetical protein
MEDNKWLGQQRVGTMKDRDNKWQGQQQQNSMDNNNETAGTTTMNGKDNDNKWQGRQRPNSMDKIAGMTMR